MTEKLNYMHDEDARAEAELGARGPPAPTPGRALQLLGALLKKHTELEEQIEQFGSKSLGPLTGAQLEALGDMDRNSPEVQSRLAQLKRRFDELKAHAKERRKRLEGAKEASRLQAGVDTIEMWVVEKEKLLCSLVLSPFHSIMFHSIPLPFIFDSTQFHFTPIHSRHSTVRGKPL